MGVYRTRSQTLSRSCSRSLVIPFHIRVWDASNKLLPQAYLAREVFYLFRLSEQPVTI